MAKRNKMVHKTVVHEQEDRQELGINCPKCRNIRWAVRRTEPKDGFIRRIRICIHCGYRIITTERHD